jgi:hypothetical protein
LIPEHSRVRVGLKRGDAGPAVAICQEHLTLAGHPVIIDGDFGPATERALVSALGAPVVSASMATWLTAPLSRALAAEGSLLDIARAYLVEHPREVGGNNRGPWVRTVSDGVEGRAWCGYAVRHLARQAGEPWAERVSPSCDVTAARALHDERWSSTPIVGGLFLVRRTAVDWTHMGIVMDAGPGWISTWEGNGLPLAAPVVTPTGWRAIGDLAVGDRVSDPGGATDSVVTGVYPQGERDVFEVRFTDGSKVVADGSHRWKFHHGATRAADAAVFTTEEARGVLASGGRLYLPAITPPVFEPSGPMPLDPYLLGLLVGDGGTTEPSAVRFTTDDPEMLAELVRLVPPGCVVKRVDRFTHRVIGPIHDAIRALGLAGKGAHEKAIPRPYLWTSPANRLALLQGLMDTDGSIDPRGRMEFCTTSPQLARDVQFLVQSLGGKVRICPRTGITYTSPCQATPKAARDAYVLRNVRFPNEQEIVPFRLARKAARMGRKSAKKVGWGVESIEPAGRAETVCIAVSAPSRLYMTEHFIPTHNTNDEGSREGHEVCSRTRGLGRLDFVRLGA